MFITKTLVFKLSLLTAFISIFISTANAQTETIPSGSFIINMGNTNVASINDDVKPYGLIYDLMRNHNVPVKWVINQSKAKDGADFTHNGIIYKGGTFIIPAPFRTIAVNNVINTWTNLIIVNGKGGVIGATSVSDFSTYVYKTLTSIPRWTLDNGNGGIAEAYLIQAGITNTTFPGAYNWKAVSALDCCDDFFVMPHADPTWATHNRLYSWNQTCLGSIWAACHAVSALENSINPANTTEQMNFLSTRTAVVAPTPWPNNSLKLWGQHSGGSVPYSFNPAMVTDPVAQYMGVTDLSQLNGSEQIYIPKQPADVGGATRWRSSTNIVSYDPSQVNVPVPDLVNGNVAALIAYGRGMGDPTRGYVMYEAGHSHLKGTTSDGPALRAFLNFSFFQVQPKAPQLTVTGITAGQIIPGTTTITGLNVAATSPLSGITFNYQWISTCGGTFSNPSGTILNPASPITNFTAPTVASNTPCIISVKVTDNCGRTSVQSFPVTIKAANPPVAGPDAVILDPGCSGNPSITYNVLANDSDPNGDPITLTLVNGNAGSFTTGNGGQVSFTAAGNITYVAAEGFTGADNLTYQVCDNTTPTALCTNSTFNITVGDPLKVPTVVNDAAAMVEDALTPLVISVLTNDVQVGGYTGGALTVRSVTSGPTNGRVSVNPDNTITYIPNADFGGPTDDVFTYEVVNASGYRRSATVTVTVTNNDCDAGTYEVSPATSGQVTLPASGDTYLNQDKLLENYGAGVDININHRDADRVMRTIIKFDLTTLPAGVTVTNANLRLYANRDDGQFATNVHRVTSDWNESAGVAGGTANLAANWTNRIEGTPDLSWTTGGGDFDASILATRATFSAQNTYSDWSSAALATVVQNWKSGAFQNYGVIIKPTPTTENLGGDDRWEFNSRNAASNLPQLVVDYNNPAVCDAIPNRTPLANPDYGYSTNSLTPLVISDVKTNDTDEGALTVTGATLISGSGAVGTITANGFTFTPTAGFAGAVVVEYTVSDGTLTDVARVTITVTNAPISASDDISSANSGLVQNINVMSNDTDPENQKGVLSIVTAPVNGTAVVFDNGTPANFADDIIQYTPNAGYTGPDNFVYQVCEDLPVTPCPDTPNCATATVNVTVVNQPPLAVNDGFNFPPCQATKINLIGNDTDPEAGILTVTIVTPPASGTLVNNNDGTVTFTPVTGTGSPITFTYTVTDNGVTPLVSAPATVTLTLVTPVNNPPVAGNDVTDPQYMGEIFYTSVLDNDSDPDNNPLTLPIITVAPLHGTAIVLENGLIQYTPNPGWYGSDILTYEICDLINNPAICTQSNGVCVTATVSYVILPPANTTNAYNDEHSTWQDVDVSNNVLTNDADAESDPQVLDGFFDKDADMYVTTGTFNVYVEDGVTLAGTLTVAANGDFTFDPLPTFIGTVSVPYKISDVVIPTGTRPTALDSAFLKITVNPLPVVTNSVIANNDEYATPLNTDVVSSVTAYNDFDPQGNTFTVTSYTFDTDGNGTQDGVGTLASAIQIGGISTTGIPTTNAGTLLLNADGTFTFNPKDDFTGSIDVVYTITDALGATTTAVLHIDILPDTNPGNDIPFAGDDFKYTNVNTPVSGNVLSNDSDPNAGNTISATAQTTTNATGELILAVDGSYTFTPAVGYTGPAVFPYTICDNLGLCTEATLHFLVGIDNSTDAINDENSTWQDVNLSGGVVANDFDAESNTQTFGSFLAQGATPGAAITTGATLSGVDKLGLPVPTAGVITFAADGSYTFDPDPAFTGTVSIPYRLCDNGNLLKCDTAYLTITVDPLPTTGTNTVIANNDENISYGAAVGGSLFVNDRDPQNDAFTVTSFVGGTVGTPGTVAGVDLNGNPIADAGTLTINEDGTYTFTPTAGFVGSINVPYTITDANGATSTAILHIDVLKDPNGPQNDPPVAGDDFGYTTINKPVTGSFISNDSDPNADPVSYMGVTIVPAGPATPIGAPVATAQGGTVQFYANGTYLYTPPTDYIGPDMLPYTICDVTVIAPQPLCADATIHLLVGPGINIAGKVWDDANGNVLDPGASEPETNAGGTLYVNLIDGSGNVVATTAVAGDGTYSFSNVNPGATYSLQLTINQGTFGQPAPAVELPAPWTNTGETRDGTIDGGTAGIIDSRNYGFTNTVNFDFGIEQLPNTDPYTTNISQPIVDQFITLDGGANPPIFSGSDPEDCMGTCGALTSRTIIIDAIPTNSELYYNGVLVTNGQQINNFDPSLLQVKITSATLGLASTSFQYSFVDAAGKKDPTPAIYTLTWLTPLPATGFKASATLLGTMATIKWQTLSEQNTDYFIVERSLDNLTYTSTGVNVAAAGTSVSKKEYQQVDNINNISQTENIYYRVKLIDIDGRFKYSNVVVVRLSRKIGISTWPNPFNSSVTVSITTLQNTELFINLSDVTGRVILTKNQSVNRGISQVVINELDRLSNGVYLLEVFDKNSGNKTVFKLVKE